MGAVALWLAVAAPCSAPAHPHRAPPPAPTAAGDASGSPPASDPHASDQDASPQGASADGAPDQSAPVRAAAGAEPSATDIALARWVTRTHDNGERPFVIVDKVAAAIFVFDPHGLLLGSAPALVGLARGDDSAAGVGERQLSAISPDERTTPAGRFVAGFGAAVGHHHTVLWVDYADAISLHPVVTTNPSEHRLKRIKSADPDEHRISYGCINVPASFYDKVVLKAFAGGTGIVYILPDTRPIEEVFPVFAADARASAIADQNAREAAATVAPAADQDAPMTTQSDQAPAAADPPGAPPAETAQDPPAAAKAADKPAHARRRHHPHPAA